MTGRTCELCGWVDPPGGLETKPAAGDAYDDYFVCQDRVACSARAAAIEKENDDNVTGT